jgi:hypothetical protein
MTTSKLKVWGGVLTAVVGALLILFGVLPIMMLPTSEPLIEWVLDADWSVLNGLALIMTVLTPLALISLYLSQVEESGKLGFVGFAMAFIGAILFSSVQFDEALLWRILAEEAPALLDIEGPMFTSPGFSSIYLLMGVLYILGFVLFGIATIRGGVFPRVAAVLLVIGVPLFAGGFFLPQLLRTAGAVLAGAGLIWLGLALRGQQGDVAAQPPSVV